MILKYLHNIINIIHRQISQKWFYGLKLLDYCKNMYYIDITFHYVNCAAMSAEGGCTVYA